MIIKSLSRKDGSFAQLVGYIARGHNPQSLTKTQTYTRDLVDNLLGYIDRDHDALNPPITHNINADTIATQSIVQAFRDNADLLPQRKNGVVLYHEILAFNEHDTPHLTHDVMSDLTRKYLELRAPGALAFAKIHLDTGHKHVHIMLSANDAGMARRNRLSKAKFRDIKHQVEVCQRDRYPELTHSIAQPIDERLGITLPVPKPRPETPHAPDRSAIKAHVLELLTTTDNPAQFMDRLTAYGFEIQQRGNTYSLRHIASDKRFRLKTIDLLDAYEQAQAKWHRTHERLEELQRDHTEKVFWPVRELLGTVAKINQLIPELAKPLSRIGKRFAQIKEIVTRRFRDRSGPDRDR